MNLQRIRRICKGNYVNIFRSLQNLSRVENEIELLPKLDPQISKISSGITLAAVENFSPVTQVSVIIKAGSRYERPAHNEGIVHLLRNCSVLSTKHNTAFNTTRSLETLGAKLRVASTKEHLVYSLECFRDNIDPGLQILSDVITNGAFKPWELDDLTQQLRMDLALYNNKPETILFEALHKVAFRGGLSNSNFIEPFLIGKHSAELLHEYINQNFTTNRTSVVGLGISHDHLEEMVNELLQMKNSSISSDVASKFASGEIRLDSDFPLVHTAIVAEGASIVNTKERLALGILECILGLGSKSSKLSEAAGKCTSGPFYVSSININYTETGLFGVYLIGLPQDMRALVKAVVTQMRDVSKNITENVVEVAKHKLKAKLQLERDASTGLLSAMGTELSHLGKINDLKALDKIIDEIQAADVSSIASKVVKAKPAMSSVGRLHSTPHIDELL